MSNYKTPGVYVEEISTFPPSVAEVESAIPAFIGYTEKTGPENEPDPVLINSFLEYETHFGGAVLQAFKINLSKEDDKQPISVEFDNGDNTAQPFIMHAAVELFYANGGGKCYIVSVGNYEGPNKPTLDDFANGLEKIKNSEEITLVVVPEACQLDSMDQYSLYDSILSHCGGFNNRFGIFDLRPDDKDASDFRDGIGTSYLDKGAAYYPHLKTFLGYRFEDSNVQFFSDNAESLLNGLGLDELKLLQATLEYRNKFDGLAAKLDEDYDDLDPWTVEELKPGLSRLIRVTRSAEIEVRSVYERTKNLIDPDNEDTDFDLTANFENVKSKIQDAANKLEDDDETILSGEIRDLQKEFSEDSDSYLKGLLTKIVDKISEFESIKASKLADLFTDDDLGERFSEVFNSKFISDINKLLKEEKRTLPPSSAIAGIYARVDADRGVWKAPANVSLNRVIGPEVRLSLTENDHLNIHQSGKSVNAIRAFTGRGTLVWGARTLDGNSNEWRYIPVRRLFGMVEESCKLASFQFVFEPNDANTWVKVKAMLENYLILLWRAGALMGTKSDEAFFVNVGLGETMTEDDIHNGRMIVEIGMAAVRPAEFIILRFSHKMLEN